MMSAQDGSVVGAAAPTTDSAAVSKLKRVRGLFSGPGSSVGAVSQPASSAQDQVVSPTQSVAPTPPPAPASVPTQDQALDVADSVISQVLAQRSVVVQAQEAAQAQAQASAGQKEREAALSPDSSQVETATGIQVVEQEKQPELPPEVEGFLQHIDNHDGQAPTEVVLNDLSEDNYPKQTPKQSVIVVPITPEVEAEGSKKNPTFSVRWLVEWSQKLIKMFQGKVVYRQVEE